MLTGLSKCRILQLKLLFQMLGLALLGLASFFLLIRSQARYISIQC